MCGVMFKDIYQFKEVLKKNIIKDCRDIVFIKNEKIKVTIKRKKIYEWKLHASNVIREMSFQIRDFYQVYNYGRRFMSKQVATK